MIPSVSSHGDHQSIPVCQQLTHSLRHGTYFSKNRKISEKLKLLVSLQKCHSCKVDSRARAQVCCVYLPEASKDLLIGLWVPTWHSTRQPSALCQAAEIRSWDLSIWSYTEQTRELKWLDLHHRAPSDLSVHMNGPLALLSSTEHYNFSSTTTWDSEFSKYPGQGECFWSWGHTWSSKGLIDQILRL